MSLRLLAGTLGVAGLVAGAGVAVAQAPTTVSTLIADGYTISASFAVEGGYGVLLTKGADVMLCQISFKADGAQFTTDRCYPVN